jgi:uncharacterized protein YaaQ
MSTKLLLAVIRGDQRSGLVRHLNDAGFHVTEFSSTGGFFRRNNVTLMIGAPEDDIPNALDIIRNACATPEGADEHLATIFVLNAGQFIPL